MLEIDRREQNQHGAEDEADECPAAPAVAGEAGCDERRRCRGHDECASAARQELAQRTTPALVSARPLGRGPLSGYGYVGAAHRVHVGVGPDAQFEGLPAMVFDLGCATHVELPPPPVVTMVAVQAPLAFANRIVEV